MTMKTMFLLCAAFAVAVGAAESVTVDFARGKWNPADWKIIKSPRWEYCHGFTQKDGWIENETPEGLSPEEIATKCSSTTYSGMVWKDRVKLGVTISTTTGWDWQMAPLLVIAPELGVSKDGKWPEVREHWEIVVYNRGLNVWHHFWTPEKGPHWVKAASLTLPERECFKANEKHSLSVQVRKTRKGNREMICSCGGYTLQYVDDSLPETFHVGLIGCEGRNMFWDFAIR